MYIRHHLHFTANESPILIMGFYEDYTAKLERQADDSQIVLRVLKVYEEMGDDEFSLDLNNFLCLDNDSFYYPDDKKRLRNIILAIRQDMEKYRKCRDQVKGAILEIESILPSRGVNRFARNLYVHVLRGDGFFERYSEDVGYAMEYLSVSR